ncbi:MAG TPA: hypothetical protein VFS06_05420 [Casimicrobiaceae bacterium]|jgi:hypothetical protein|nr:hypothetical protein [Casimicrobiaceae bacterium]
MVKAFATPRVRRAMWVIWPGFLSALVAEMVFFAIFDPLDFNARLALTRETVYTVGFVGFWLLGMLSSALTLFLQQVAPQDDAFVD